MVHLETKTKGILTVFGGFLIHLTLGTMYLWGNINIYVRSFFCFYGTDKIPEGQTTCEHCQLSLETVGVVFPLIFTAMCALTGFSIPLADKIGYKLSALISSLCLAGCIFFASYAENFWLFSALYGLLFGGFGGIIYMIPFNLGHRYFPNHKGRISGLISCGFGLGSIFFGMILFQLINPDNIESEYSCYPKNVADNLPTTLRWLSLMYLAVMIIGSLLLSVPTEEDEKEIQRYSQPKEKQDNELYNPIKEEESQNQLVKEELWECPDVKTALKQPTLYTSILLVFFLSNVGILFASQFSPYAIEFPNLKDPNFLSWVGNLGSVMNFLSRIFWGQMMDILSFKTICIIMTVIQATLALTFNFATAYQGLYLLWVLLSFGVYGGIYAIVPTVSTRWFGKKAGLTVVGIIFQAFTIAAWAEFVAVEIALDGATENSEKQDRNNIVFKSFAASPILGLLMVIFVKFDINWKKILMKASAFSYNSGDKYSNSNIESTDQE